MTRRRDVLAMMAAVPVAAVMPAVAEDSIPDMRMRVRGMPMPPFRATVNGCPCEVVGAEFNHDTGMWMLSLREIGGAVSDRLARRG